jgi:hypothetical protein
MIRGPRLSRNFFGRSLWERVLESPGGKAFVLAVHICTIYICVFFIFTYFVYTHALIHTNTY